ncbi:MAG: hypothetical protein AAFX09_05450 [Pseudomonadota bacterium]
MTELPHHLKQDIDEGTLSIEHSPSAIKPHLATVRLTMEPRSIPSEIIKHLPIAEKLFEKFRVMFDTSTIAMPPGTEMDGPVDRFIRYKLDEDQLVTFKGGYSAFGGEDFISIGILGFGRENIIAMVYGTTRQAEHLCKLLAEELWRICGTERKWSELSDCVQFASHITETEVDFGFSFDRFFAPGFNLFLREDIEGRDGLGRHIGIMGQRNPASREELIVRTAYKHIEMDIGLFDGVSGDSEQSFLRIRPSTRKDINRSLMSVSSELPFDQHVQMVERLISKLKD